MSLCNIRAADNLEILIGITRIHHRATDYHQNHFSINEYHVLQGGVFLPTSSWTVKYEILKWSVFNQYSSYWHEQKK